MIRHGVIGHINVKIAVVIRIQCGDGKTRQGIDRLNPRLQRRIGERAIACIDQQDI